LKIEKDKQMQSMRLPSVLIIDDDADTRATIMLILSQQFDCMSVPSRNAALELLQAGYRPSCVLMDYCMPGMELDEFLKQSQPFKLQVVLMTAFFQADRLARTFGLRGFLEKPLCPDATVQMVEWVIEGARRASTRLLRISRRFTNPMN
jgi:DNA-binding NtrC family response regulator